MSNEYEKTLETREELIKELEQQRTESARMAAALKSIAVCAGIAMNVTEVREFSSAALTGSRAALDALLAAERRKAAVEELIRVANDIEDRCVPHGFDYIHSSDLRNRAAAIREGRDA